MIFENGASAPLLAKYRTKKIILYLSWLRSYRAEIQNLSQLLPNLILEPILTLHIVAILDFCDLGVGPQSQPLPLFFLIFRLYGLVI